MEQHGFCPSGIRRSSSDQTPERFPYGTMYSREAIDEALRSEDPFSIVPTRDTEGHGTFIAGIMAGSEDVSGGFIGAAPEASIAAVKLKPAKEYLRNYYVLRDDALAYQETDVMMAVEFLRSQSSRYRMPLIICIGIGNGLEVMKGRPLSASILILSIILPAPVLWRLQEMNWERPIIIQDLFSGPMIPIWWSSGLAKAKRGSRWKSGERWRMFFRWK